MALWNLICKWMGKSGISRWRLIIGRDGWLGVLKTTTVRCIYFSCPIVWAQMGVIRGTLCKSSDVEIFYEKHGNSVCVCVWEGVRFKSAKYKRKLGQLFFYFSFYVPSHPTKLTRHKIKIPIIYFLFRWGDLFFQNVRNGELFL